MWQKVVSRRGSIQEVNWEEKLRQRGSAVDGGREGRGGDGKRKARRSKRESGLEEKFK